MPRESYSGPVIDSHMHLWSLEGGNYPWLSPTGGFPVLPDMKGLQRDFGIGDYLSASQGQNVEATVHIEALWDPEDDPVNETIWLESLSKNEGIGTRYVSGCRFGTDATESVLHRQAEFDRVVGVRQTIAWHPVPSLSPLPQPGLSAEAAWRAGAAVCDKLGMSLDILMFPWQAREILSLASSLPDLTIVINHCGSPIERTDLDLAEWDLDLKLLARAPNIYMKISSLSSYDAESTASSYERVIYSIVDAFGPSRSMFGSDWPVGMLNIGYGDVLDKFRRASERFSADEQRELFYGTAANVYKFD